MAEELTMVLERRAERGSPRGAAVVLAEARQLAASPSQPPWWRRGPAIALATAAVVLFVLGGILLATRGATPDTVPPATTMLETPTVPATTALSQIDTAPAPGGADVVSDLALAPDGRLWAATNAGVVMWNLETGLPTVFSEREGLPDRYVYRVTVATDGTVWAAGGTWVARLDGTAWTDLTTGVFTDRPSRVGDLTTGPDGSVWVAAGPDALIRIDGEEATTHRVPGQWSNTEPWSFSIAVDSDGTVWASTMLFGALTFNGEWGHFDGDDGLPSDVIGNIAVAPDGSVWVGGEGVYGDPDGDVAAAGILRYQDNQWTTYTTADGLLSDSGTVTVDPAGGVWVVHTAMSPEASAAFGTDLPDGISYFDGTAWQQLAPAGGRGPGVVNADGILWLPTDGGIVGFDGVETRRLTVGGTDVPPLPSGDVTRLEPAEGLDPVRIETVIGDIEFTTWALPEDWEGIWWLSETAHGVVGARYPDMTLVGSLDGITWTEIPLSGVAGAWTAYGDDLIVFGAAGAARIEWNGAEWVEAEIFADIYPLYAAAGPHGIAAVGPNASVHYSADGTAFTAASAPPDPSLYPGPGANCMAPGWTSEGAEPQLGPIAATDRGFIALAARSETDWYRTPICEPLVWFSADGDVWETTSDESPLGERAFVHDVAAVDQTIVVVGGAMSPGAATWVSADGISWQRADSDAAELWQVAGSSRGWVTIGHLRPDGLGGEMWFSADGLTWDGPHERPPGWGDRAGMFVSVAMLDDRIIGFGREGDGPRIVVGVFIDE